ncbi:MAG TPA: hypothetical protein VJU54_01330 [Nitrospiraceae bacterium]|nr:hypothetical protein [Nitrospiraceae bacterium]
MHPPVLILLVGVLLMLGCTRGPTAVLDPASRDPDQDHWAIASYYTREAAASRQQAEEMTNQAMVYERLFGRESDWVSGAKLLVQFYEEAAREQDRLADLHLELARGRSSNQPIQSRGH